MFNVKRLAKFLATGVMPEMTALDESLAEHDKKYHPDGYKEGDSCNKRENMAKNDDEKIPERGSESSDALSEERKTKIADWFKERVNDMGTPMNWIYDGVPGRKVSPLKWEGDKFELSISGLSRNESDNLRKEAMVKGYLTSEDKTKLESYFEVCHFKLTDVRCETEELDTGVKYNDDQPKLGIYKGNPILQYRMKLSGKVKDVKEEAKKQYEEGKLRALELARKGVADPDKYEAKMMTGKLNYENGPSYEVLGIVNKKTDMAILTYVVDGNGKTATRRSWWGEAGINISDIESDVREHTKK